MSSYDFESKLRFSYGIDTYYDNGVGIRRAYSVEDAEWWFHKDISRSKCTDRKVVLTHDGYIFTDRSRYQAELALSYLRENYPTYTNFRIFGTGEWDDPYGVHMEKTLKVYDVRSKKIINMEADDEK